MSDSTNFIPQSIRNAGLCLMAPFFSRLFRMWDYLDDSHAFKNQEYQIKAIFALQYLVTGKTETDGDNLFLNKLLTGYDLEKPLPVSSCDFSKQELDTLESLQEAVKTNWDKMRNTSIQGIQNTFFAREGTITKDNEEWLLRVSPKAYDILLNSLPWNYRFIKYPWMPLHIRVDWR